MVLLSQLAGGVVGGLAHQRAGNVKLDFRRDDELIKERLRGLGYLPRSTDVKVVLILGTGGVIGVLVGAFTAVSIPIFRDCSGNLYRSDYFGDRISDPSTAKPQ